MGDKWDTGDNFVLGIIEPLSHVTPLSGIDLILMHDFWSSVSKSHRILDFIFHIHSNLCYEGRHKANVWFASRLLNWLVVGLDFKSASPALGQHSQCPGITRGGAQGIGFSFPTFPNWGRGEACGCSDDFHAVSAKGQSGNAALAISGVSGELFMPMYTAHAPFTHAQTPSTHLKDGYGHSLSIILQKAPGNMVFFSERRYKSWYKD